jgi:hypothetical protein
MAQLGLDYSTARPGGALLAAKGVKAVGRYLGTDSRCITSAEYQDLKAHGIDVWLVFESQTQDLSTSMLNGYAKGVSDARRALAAIAAASLPASSPVYWAADFDIGPSGSVQPRVAPSESYVDGWNTIIPAARRGGYGGLWFLNYLHGKGKVDFLWECASTSFRHGVNPANVPLHIQQTVQAPPIAGTDYNNIFDTTSFAGNGGATLLEDDTMKLQALRNYDGSIGIIDDAGLLHPLSLGEWNCYLRLGIVQQQADGSYWLQQTDGTVWNALTTLTARVRAAQSGDPKALSQTTAALVVPAVIAGLQAAGASGITQAEVEAAAEAAIKNVLAAASK